jgi:acetoin:2,6-dichlorophenolindophenol oxidoreductase subunit beta
MSTRVEANRAALTEETPALTYRDAIRAALEDELSSDPSVLFLGEDVANEGGVFKTSVGLVEQFGPQRVRNTPICENGFLGVALGMALTGLRPVVEIMFSDFLPTAGDAIVNELPKFRFMSGGQCHVPLTIRSIGGGTGRFGTQHSATGESWFIGLPGLKVATASSPALAYGVLRAAIRDDDPVLFFEHKGLYGRKAPIARGEDALATVGRATILRRGSDVTILSTLLMADRSAEAAALLADEGIDVELVDPTWLRPLDMDTIAASVEKTGRLLVVEEQVHAGGWGATVISRLVMAGAGFVRPPRALGLPEDLLVPYSPQLEDAMLPTSESIADAARALMG